LTPAPELAFLHVMRALPRSMQQTAGDQIRRLEALRETVGREVSAGGITRCCVRLGEPLDQILLYAAELRADAVLLGHDPRRRGRRSLARRFAAAAPCALWMAPNGAQPHIGRVLAAFDFSASSAEAVRAAAVIARSAGLAELYLLHVRRGESPTSDDDLQRFVSELGLDQLATRLVVEEGGVVGRVIVESAARLGADLVVVGARGQNPAATVLLGSETEQTLRESSVPVLVVKASASHIVSANSLLTDQASAGKL
jgi:nucleotide-binding universal stress UspA family protein